MADIIARRSENVTKRFVEIDEGEYAEQVVAVNADGSSIGGGGGGEAPATAGAFTSVANAAADGQVLSENVDRKGATVFNDDATATANLALGFAASATDFSVKLGPGDYYEVPFGYTGEIRRFSSAATGNLRVTELT
jgi:hypothetical protein